MVAIETEKIRNHPEAHGNRQGNGAPPQSLASCVIVAQRVLPEERRKSPGGIHTMKDLVGWYKHFLAQRDVYFPKKPTLAAAPPPDPVNSLAEQFMLLLSQAIDQGVTRALERFHMQHEPEVVDLRRGNGNGNGGGMPVELLAGVLTPKRRIDVVGLRGQQIDLVERSQVAQQFEIRYINADQAASARDLREVAVLCTKFIRHDIQDRYKAMHATIHFANGGPQSVIRQLQSMATTAH
jgi:hypothetical protein